MKLKNYSSGMRRGSPSRYAIQSDADVLLLDEVLAVGDPPFAQRCQETFEELKRTGRSTVVLVTHSVASLVRHCDRAMMLEAGGIRASRRSRRGGSAPGTTASGRPASGSSCDRAPVRILEAGRGRRARAMDRHVQLRSGRPLALRVILGADEPIDSARLRLWLTTSTGAPIFAPPLDLASGTTPSGSAGASRSTSRSRSRTGSRPAGTTPMPMVVCGGRATSSSPARCSARP